VKIIAFSIDTPYNAGVEFIIPIDTTAIKNASSYGCTYDDTILQAAITDIGSKYRTLNIAYGTWQIDKDLTFNVNTKLRFEEGAKFAIDKATVTINGDIDAGLYQIFDCSESGTISFTKGALKELHPEWWGDGGDVSMSALLLEDSIDICNSNYQWVKSPAGTDEYYLQLSSGGAPKIDPPWTVNENGSSMKSGKVDSLAKGEWGWGDPDAQLGHNTIVVRLTDANEPDPENKAGGFLDFQAGNRFFYCSDPVGGFQLRDCLIESHNKDYNYIYTNYYNTSTFEMYIKDSDFNRKFDIIPFQKFTYNPGLLIIEGSSYIKFFYLY